MWPIFLFPFTQNLSEVLLVNVTIIDGTGAPPLRNHTILIRKNRIAAVGTKINLPNGAKVINLAGKTAIPGLIDMHAHMYARTKPQPAPVSNQFEAYPLLYLAGGITTVRSPGDFDPEGMITLRERINRKEVIGP